MSKDPKDDKDQEDYVAIPDFAELWKEMYFQTEATLADATRQFTNTKGFSQFIDSLLQQYLSIEKINRQTIDAYMETAVIPSKKDVARVAELVISLEEKVDNIEFENYNTMKGLVNSLFKLVEAQEQVKNDMAVCHQSLKSIEEKLDDINEKFANAPEVKLTPAKTRGRKKRIIPKEHDNVNPE